MPDKPEPQDHKPKAANVRKDEAAAKLATVKFRQYEFTIERDQAEWPLELFEALEDDRELGAMRAALGDVQWATIRSMKLKGRDLEELTAAVVAALGFGSTGESTASPS